MRCLFLVLLEEDVWLSPLAGDSCGRATCAEHARRYREPARARRALAKARKHRQFTQAQIVPSFVPK